MTKYKEDYQNIWAEANGPIPRESNGRLYHIHHINGDHSDNRLENLICITNSEHSMLHNTKDNHPMLGKGHLISGEKNGMFGRNHTECSRKKISESETGSKNHRYDGNVYKFLRLETGLIVEATRSEMKEKYGLRTKELFRTKPRKSAYGWTVVR